MNIKDFLTRNKVDKELKKLAILLDYVVDDKDNLDSINTIKSNLIAIGYRNQNNKDVYDVVQFILGILPTLEIELIKWKENRNKEGE